MFPTLIADTPATSQSMIDIVLHYTQNQKYQWSLWWLSNGLWYLMVFGETTRSRRIARVHRLGFTVLQEVDEQHHLLHFKISVQLISCKDVWEVNSWKIEVHSLHWTLYTLALALSTLLLLSSYITLSISQFLLYGSESWFGRSPKLRYYS